MKVLFLTNIPSPYRVDFFNELGKSVDLTVVFEKKFSAERDDAWKNYSFTHFKGVFLKGISLGTATVLSFGAIKFVKDKSFDYIICSNFSSPTGFLTVRYMEKHHIPYYLETDGGSPKSGNGLKEKLKAFVIGNAAGCFSTCAENDRYFLSYGAKKEIIYRYPFTSLYNSDVFESVSDDEGKGVLREKLGIKERKIIISVGRFSYLNGYGKGYDVLIKTAEGLPKDIGWYVVGGEPTEEFEQKVESAQLENFHFIDFKSKNELKEYYRAADIFVLMSVGEAWGLVINESMSCGLPVITTDKCIAGVELIRNGENGYIVSVGDADSLKGRVSEIIYDNETLKRMGEKSLEIIKPYTFEKMVSKHIDLFNGNIEHV